MTSLNECTTTASESFLGRRFLGDVFIAVTLLVFVATCSEVAGAQSYLTTTGTPTFAAPEPAEYGFVETANGNLHLEFPLGSFPQRANSQGYAPRLIYDSPIWQIYNSGGSLSWGKSSTAGNLLETGWSFGGATLGRLTENDYGWQACGADFVWTDLYATTHYFPLPTVETVSSNPNQCPTSANAFATDSSGFRIYYDYAGYTIKVYAPDGTLVLDQKISGYDIDGQGHIVLTKDTNGNYLSMTDDSSYWVLDTLERIPVKKSLCGPGGGECFDVTNSQADTSRSHYVIAQATISVNTAFGQSGVAEYSGTMTVAQSLTLADGTSFSFKYDCDSTLNSQVCGSPHGQGAYYGMITSMTLPTGGQVSYNYTTFSDSYGNKTRWLYSKVSSGVWSYSPQVISTCSSTQVGCQQKITVNRPTGENVVTTFTLDNGAWPTLIQEYDQQGNLVATTTKTWDFSNACTLHLCHGHNYIRMLSQTVTIPVPGGTSLTKKTAYTYDSPQQGNVTAVQEWKFLPGTSPSFPSVPDRARYMSYASLGTNIINKPLSITLCNNTGSDSYCTGGGSKVSQTLIQYDSYGSGLTLISNVANHDDTNYGTGNTVRGNPTQIQQWVSGSTYLTTQNVFDTTGQVLQTTDPAGNLTTITYPDNFYTETAASSMSQFTPTYSTNAYPKTITQGGLTTTFGYYFGSGKNAFSIDPNNQTTSHFFWDNSSVGPAFDRPTETLYPIGWNLTNYTSAIQADAYVPVADTAPSQSCTSCQHKEVTLDTWGRAVKQQLVNAPGGAVNVDTTYDGYNRVASESHAYVNTTDPSHVFETFTYDVLNRKTYATHPDGQSSKVFYGPSVSGTPGGLSSQQGSTSTYGYGYPVLTIEETGTKKRQEWIDGFGRIIEVDEPTTAPTPGSGSVAIGGAEQSAQICTQHLAGGDCGRYTTRYDYGTVSITINSVPSSTSYANGSSSSSLATALASAINSNANVNSLVTASATDSTVTITAKQGGSQTDYSLSAVATTGDPNDFPDGSYYTTASGSTLTGGFNAGSVFSTPQVTLYSYDAGDRLTQVVQGVQTRTFTYDGLRRMTSRTTPEAGTDSFYFTKSDNVSLCAGSLKAVCRKSDARGVLTTFSYDGLSRLLGKNYTIPQGSNVAAMPSLCVPAGTSLPAQNVCYNYDQGGAGAYALGRMTQVQYSINTQSIGSDTYTYNQGGRVTQVQTQFGGMNWTMQYGYNTGGQLTSITYPSSRVVTKNLDVVGRLAGVTDGTTNYTSSYSYNAGQQVTGFTYGNGIVATYGYDEADSSNLTCLDYSTTSRGGVCTNDTTTKFGLKYYYNYDSTNCATGIPGNDGLINCIVDNTPNSGQDIGHAGRTVGFTYDALGRLSTGTTTGTPQYPQWGLSWAYDAYSNRLSQSISAGCVAPMICPTNSLSFAITPQPPTNPPGGAYTNRPDGFSFDASGNMSNDGQNTLTYDGENRLITSTNSGTTTTYTYDGHGQRIAKSNSVITVYIFSGGKDIAEYGYENQITSPTAEYIYSGGQLVATLSGGTKTYQHADHLSVRMITDANGNKIGEQGHFPYGEQWYAVNTTTKFFFTSYERDSESGNDYAMARFYINRFGRFGCADPVLGRPSDPQSWNRYAYVRNNPVSMSDPSGQNWLTSLVGGLLMGVGMLTGQDWLVGIGAHLAGVGFFVPQSGGGFGTPPTFPTGSISISPQMLALGKQFATPPFLDPGTAYADPADPDPGENGDRELEEKGLARYKLFENSRCRGFVNDLLGKIGIGNADKVARRILSTIYTWSEVPSPEGEGVALETTGRYSVTIFPSGAKESNQELAADFIHEGIHELTDKSDLDILAVLNPALAKALQGDLNNKNEWASLLWGGHLQAECRGAQ